MKIGTLKSYILSEEVFNNYKIRLLKRDSIGVEVEIEKDSNILLRRPFDSEADATRFISDFKRENKFFDKKRKKKRFNLKSYKIARMYEGDPKAFSDNSPSSSWWSGDGPGGLLTHYPSPRKRQKRKHRDMPRGNDWHQPSGNEKDPGGQRSQLNFKRDDEKGRNQDDLEGHGTRGNGTRPPLATDVDSIDLAKNPGKYKPNYDPISPGDRLTEQSVDSENSKRERKEEIRNQQLKTDLYKIVYKDRNGKEKEMIGLSLQEALEKARNLPGARIFNRKEKVK